MLQYEKTYIPEGIHVSKISASKECEFYHYWFFKDIGYLSAKGATFRCLLMGINKNEALTKLNNSVTCGRGVL